MADGPWRVFVSHTSELRDFPRAGSYVNAVERAIIACGHVVVDMKDFPAADKPPADLCAERVRGCAVYVGLLGMRYGSPVRDKREVSYTEFEFDTATEAGLKRLVFLLDAEAEDVGIPPSGLIDHEYGARQAAFRSRVQDSGLVTQAFTDPATLGQLVERSLRELAETAAARGPRGSRDGQVPAMVVTGEIPQEPLGFQPRAELLARSTLRAGNAGGACADRDARGGQDAPGGGVRPGQGWPSGGGWWPGSTPRTRRPAAGLAEAAAALGLDRGCRGHGHCGPGGAAPAGGRRGAVPAGVRQRRGRAECCGQFIPAAGTARVIITSNQQAMASLGRAVLVDVFSEAEALTFLAARTGQADAAGAHALAEELGGCRWHWRRPPR